MPNLNSMVGISSNKAIATFQALPVAAAAIAVLASGKSSLDGKLEIQGMWTLRGDHSTVIQWIHPFHHFIIIQLWTSWSNYHSVLSSFHGPESTGRNSGTCFSLRKVNMPPMTLALTSWWIDCRFGALWSCSDWSWQGQFPTSAPEELMGGNWLMSFFHFPPQKKRGTSTNFRSLRSCLLFPHWRLWEHCTCKILETPKPCENKLAAHLWSVPVLQTCTHGAATCENIGRPEMMQKLKTCRFREGPSANLPMKCGVWFKTCLGCCNQPVWSWDSSASHQSFGENIGHMTISSHGRTQRSQHCSG